MSAPDLDASGAMRLSGELADASMTAGNAVSVYLYCTEDSLGEGTVLPPAHEYSQFTEDWSGSLMTIQRDLVSACQLFLGLASELDKLDSAVQLQ